jgi:rhodanese-related sulfurtransferase
LVPENAELLFVLGDEPLQRVVDECLLVGYERFAGVLGGGMAAWADRGVVTAALTDARSTRKLLLDGGVALDVRESTEFAEGHIPGALHVPLGELEARAGTIPRDRPIVAYCGHGERSATALSLLERLGFNSMANFNGGFEAWQDAAMEVER